MRLYSAKETYDFMESANCSHPISQVYPCIGVFLHRLHLWYMQSLLQGSFAKGTNNFKEPTNRSHPILSFARVYTGFFKDVNENRVNKFEIALGVVKLMEDFLEEDVQFNFVQVWKLLLCMSLRTHTQINIYTYIYILIYVCMYICVYIYMYVHIYVNMCIYIYTYI